MKSILPRMSATLAGAILLFLVIAYIAPQQLPVTIYKLSLITIAAVIGYWIDRDIFPYARPDRFIDSALSAIPEPVLDETDHAIAFIDPGANNRAFLFAEAQKRRALIVVGFALAAAIGA